MSSKIQIALIVSLSVGAAYLLFNSTRTTANKSVRSTSQKSKRSQGDKSFMNSILEKREQTAKPEDGKSGKTRKPLETEADDEFEDVPDSDDERRARNVGSGRKYSNWAGQARIRRKEAASKRRMEALNRERERRMEPEAEAGTGEEKPQ